MAKVSPLRIVSWLCERHARLSAACDAALPLISACLDGSTQCSFKQAVEWDSIRLVDRLVAIDMAKGVDRFLLEHWLNEAVGVAAQQGSEEMVRRIVEHNPEGQLSIAIYYAAERGNLALVQWLFAWSADNANAIVIAHAAAGGGQKAVLEWVLDRCGREHLTSSVLANAVEHGHLDIVVWLQQLDVSTHDVRRLSGDTAARQGHLAVVKWLYDEQLTQAFSFNVLLHAVEGNSLDVVTYLHEEQGHQITTLQLNVAAVSSKHFELFQYLLRRAPHMCNVKTLTTMAIQGRVDILRYLHDRCPNEWKASNLLDCAVGAGHLELVEWIQSMRFPSQPLSRRAIVSAASNGNLDALQWLHKREIPGWDEGIQEIGVKRGHLHVVKWLHTHHLVKEPSRELLLMAVKNGDLEMVQWLSTFHHEICERAIDIAAEEGHLSITQWPMHTILRTARPKRWIELLVVDISTSCCFSTSIVWKAARHAPWTTLRPMGISTSFCGFTLTVQKVVQPTRWTEPPATVTLLWSSGSMRIATKAALAMRWKLQRHWDTLKLLGFFVR